MTSRERVIRTLEFDYPDRAPRDLWALAGVGMLRKAELDAVCKRFPSDFTGVDGRYGPSSVSRGTPGEVGTYVDEWGCEWTVGEVGVCGEVKHPPLADWSRLESWSPPWELIDKADLSRVEASHRATDKFTKVGTHVRPFERMQFLRGTENLFMDILCEPDEFRHLCKLIHEFNLRDIEMWSKTAVDAVGFMDDWGTQNALLIPPEKWRAIFKPMYKDYCDILKGAGKYIFFHSDGHIEAIYPDLIEIGIHAVNSQLFCMDIEGLAQRFKGRVTFWGEISRQDILPFGTVEDVRAAVRRVRRALDDGKGGVIAQCEWGVRDPRENIEAVFEAWSEPMERNNR
ncbi:MAG TPA: uroporphyrinogen decarboxylase family protein [Candidatus Hydrogenedentes bacterium]|nr:uroporphyrinogen decarboxylase family protein [Candidatus Hydrogenedentota bacterium]HOT50510.1 uroporphyrinogen decarboxylase family protein [Candidatus Hydrogenedentota bacterium]HPC15422.1 uroporphyrinogen decarboxylase family protein [Candidatus Hydrogenedentota bacterium]HRT21139.1 uroporphyrinogen decarboxylase family protein [Candidatus Hydrogenedentota bacterium]HRT64364.1 uroporphyrinogen decarboxylase family protein [Candidatus Hydrogenedentota bacterium]